MILQQNECVFRVFRPEIYLKKFTSFSCPTDSCRLPLVSQDSFIQVTKQELKRRVNESTRVETIFRTNEPGDKLESRKN